MARDVEGGNFTRIHNEILDALARTDITGRQFKIVLFLIRQSYGYQAKEKALGLKDFADGTGLDWRNVDKELRELVRRRIINRTGGGRGRGNKAVYGFNKYYEQWLPAKERSTPENSSPATNKENSSPATNKNGIKFVADVQTNSSPATNCHTYSKEKKESSSKESDAAAPPVSPWIASFYRLWGRYVSSPYELESIHEWEGRVPLGAWEYALKESSDASAKNWKYLTRILERVERDGVSTPTPNGSQGDADFVMEELL